MQRELGFGDGFGQAAGVLKWLVIAQLINTATGSVGVILSMTGSQKAAMWTLVFAVFLKLACSFLLIPVLGAEGAAIGTFVMLLTQNLLQLVLVKSRTGLDPSFLGLLGRFRSRPLGESGVGL